MNLTIASDHGAIELRQALIDHITTSHSEIRVTDLGTHVSESVDYPNIADQLVDKLNKKEADLGVLCCGTGIGMSIRANRYPGIRAALVYDEFTAKMAKAHNNANVLCLGGRTLDIDTSKRLIDSWLEASFEGGRHQKRVDKLDAPFV